MENYITTLTNLLGSLPGNKSNTVELEIRVGKYSKYGNFISEISRYIYNNLITNLLKDDNYSVKRVMNKIMLFEYNNERYRYITQDYNWDNKTELSKKKLIRNIDIHNMDLRLSYNTEQVFFSDPNFIQMIKNNNHIKKDYKDRIRTSFYHKTIGIVIELTQDTIYRGKNVGSNNKNTLKGEKVYQWEVEFLDLPKVQSGELSLKNFISNVVNIIQFINKLKNNLYYEDIIQNNFNYLYTKKDRFLYKKPINLKEENIPYLQDYLVRPKLDGIAYFLVILNNGIFLLNNSDTISLPFKDSVINSYGKNRFSGKYITSIPNIITEQFQSLINTIILTEYMTNKEEEGKSKGKEVSITLFNYLLIKIGGKDVSHTSLEKNMIELKNITTLLNGILDIKLDVIHTERFYKGNNNTSETLTNLLQLYNLPNDGLIFEPIYRETPDMTNENTLDTNILNPNILNPNTPNLDISNRNIPYTVSNISYKWKPESLNSVDLLTIPTNHKNWYAVLMETKKGLEPFTGTYDYKYNSYVYISDKFIKENKNPEYTIIEYVYDSNNKILSPYRIRWDKTEPNFIDTVLSVWSDMMNPLSETQLMSICDLVLIKEIRPNDVSQNNKLHNTEIVCEFLKKTINPFIFKGINTYLGYTDISEGYKDACLFKLGNVDENIDSSEYKRIDTILMVLYEYFTGRLNEE